ncbi:hypothetical protein AURANDRAFT_58917 [Aureococcus anophagefferens]|uniref:C2H2-type domain-containing protein n=1 Tax=Aureococcus anophagefferens TaxID=44056 RepID=F0Y5V4_AURAN|nr:hypothetical protein AURANDRAFT_58917 [Aureococcus anophagefferens]EGB09728.1 hypothetical protein AURANDRAFT_58917 [Aureococcus anophagefferens]|eukprot:XP_009035769.1 hypothetical protein AURANDRAFT_58917 [Aureococcus anophagefferens]
MPKHDFFSPKAISNRIKAKGLTKLRWYCEMCQKACRDENGFKCHQTSDGHLRQMRIFAENPNAVMHNYSTEFEANYVETLSRRHGTKRVHANVVYQEYIADKHHVHMNATKWETLTNFVKYLGKSGQALVDETEKGWFVAWIDRDPAALARQAALAKKRKHDMDDEERQRLEIKRRVKAGGGGDAAPEAGDMSERSAGDVKPSMLDELMQGQSSKTPPDEPKLDHWLHADIVVKCVNRKVADGAYYKKKGTVLRLVDDFVAVVRMNDSGDELQLDQDDLETVIPAVGKRVKILNGVGRGLVATLVAIDVDDFSVAVEVESGPRRGLARRGVDYEDVSRLAS